MIESPPDRLPPNEDKAARERRVFQTFAAYASRAFGLGVIPGTIKSREPPEPDILCEIRGQGPLAFELSEILDEAAMQAMSTMMSARATLLAHRAALPTHDQIALQTKFATREVRIAFLSRVDGGHASDASMNGHRGIQWLSLDASHAARAARSRPAPCRHT